jgi:hypothetical protein
LLLNLSKQVEAFSSGVRTLARWPGLFETLMKVNLKGKKLNADYDRRIVELLIELAPLVRHLSAADILEADYVQARTLSKRWNVPVNELLPTLGHRVSDVNERIVRHSDAGSWMNRDFLVTERLRALNALRIGHELRWLSRNLSYTTDLALADTVLKPIERHARTLAAIAAKFASSAGPFINPLNRSHLGKAQGKLIHGTAMRLLKEARKTLNTLADEIYSTVYGRIDKRVVIPVNMPGDMVVDTAVWDGAGYWLDFCLGPRKRTVGLYNFCSDVCRCMGVSCTLERATRWDSTGGNEVLGAVNAWATHLAFAVESVRLSLHVGADESLDDFVNGVGHQVSIFAIGLLTASAELTVIGSRS